MFESIRLPINRASSARQCYSPTVASSSIDSLLICVRRHQQTGIFFFWKQHVSQCSWTSYCSFCWRSFCTVRWARRPRFWHTHKGNDAHSNNLLSEMIQRPGQSVWINQITIQKRQFDFRIWACDRKRTTIVPSFLLLRSKYASYLSAPYVTSTTGEVRGCLDDRMTSAVLTIACKSDLSPAADDLTANSIWGGLP